MEGLEQRQLLSATGFQSPSGGGGDTGWRFSTMARNIGTVNAVQISEVESNNTFATAQVIPLGTTAGLVDTIDVGGRLTYADQALRIPSDVDYFAVDLQAGDILDIATIGSVGAVDVFYSPNQHWFGAELDASFTGTTYPYASPLQTLGDITAAQTIPQTGRYYIQLTVGATEGLYTMGLRVYRPVLEDAPVGQKQILFLDFDGATYLESEFDPLGNGVRRLSSMSQFIDDWGLRPQDEDRIIDRIVDVVKSKFEYVGLNGTNGDFDMTGVPGDFGIEVRNSRDHADEWGINPYVSRVIIGGTVAESGVDTIGLASSIDIGNFQPAESAFLLLDQIEDLIIPIELAPGFTIIDTISTFLANVAVHEAGHYFGSWHQDNSNSLVSMMDQGGDIEGFTETGLDGIYGNADDNVVHFTNDFFSPNESIYYGREDTLNAVAHNLSSGMIGGSIIGTVYNDANRNQVQNSNEAGIAGVTVWADLDNDGVIDPSEPQAVTSSTGAYSLLAAAGAATVRIVMPAGSEATTPTSRSVTVPQNGSATADFGLRVINQQYTGRKWADLNGNGLPDSGEPGVAGVYVYLDLDGDDRLDLGEPRSTTDANGNYSLQFPGAGTYVIREVVAPGYLQTFPVGGEHVVFYNGTTPVTGKDFGNRPVRDYGDAPNTYGTLASSNGAVHGLVAGLHLGALVDAESDGFPSTLADGDNLDGLNDEDGVVLRSPLSPGNAGAIDVTVTNTTGSNGYLSAWIDLNGDGDFADAGEKFVSDMLVSASGTYRVDFNVPASATVGTTYARFRLSQSTNVGSGGYAAGGEVEDYRLQIAATPELANDDAFDVPRGSLSFALDVLANDFDLPTDPLTIDSVNTSGTIGQVIISADKRSIFYTPANNALGPDSFTYTVSNTSGTMTDTATVDLNVVFQSQVPIAVDDSFDVPEGVINQPLNVLANDVPSVFGGTRIISVGSGTSGGTVTITSGGQSVRYTPAAGFTGTEQFVYTVSDAAGQVSSAKATVHLQPGSADDDLAAFNIEFLDATGTSQINTIAAGQPFKVRVTVDDLRDLNPFQLGGLGAAYLDLLYTDGLVATTPGVTGSGFDFGIQFGSLFTNVRTGDAGIPGLIDEVGATQSLPGTTFRDPRELFTLNMVAVSPGVAEFVTDPSDTALSDTVFLYQYDADGNEVQLTELQPKDIFFGRRQLTIVPGGSDFTYAVDDSYPDQLDSNGNAIVAGQNATLRVLENDNRGATGNIQIVNVGAVGNGTVTVNNNGTPGDTNDDYLVYRANAGFVGVEQFTYTIVSGDGVQSTAKVTVTVGDASADDIVAFDLRVKDSDGNLLGPSDSLTVGEQFSVEVWVDDLRDPLFGEPRGVFAAYMDILYNRLLAEPAPPTTPTGERLGFDVFFNEAKFDKDAAVGDNYVPGLINEFGTFQTTTQGSGDPLDAQPVLLASIKMIAKAPGNLRLVADPADVSPYQDTLLFEPPAPVPISQITYDLESVQIVSAGGGEGESPYQNGSNRWDVNNDGFVSPIDALLVLNRLGRGGSGEGEGGASGNGGPTVFWDVNGDRVMSPLDALQVINYLSRKGSGEGEATVGAPALLGSVATFAEAADSVFTEIGGEDDSDAVIADDSSSRVRRSEAAAHCVPMAGSSDSSDDDDDEDFFANLL